jgi:hypothetical protein
MRRILTFTESRGVCTGTGTVPTGWSGTGTSTGAFLSSTFVIINCFVIFNTVFLIQELASVDMKRILTSRAAVERADAAALVRERSIHPWRHLDSSAARRHTISSRTDLGGGAAHASLWRISPPRYPQAKHMLERLPLRRPARATSQL